MPRGDKNNEKAEKAIKIINDACVQRNIPMTNHTNINSKRHLNRSKLHLNGYGKSIFIRNLKYFLKDFDCRNKVHDQHVSKSSPSLNDSVNDSLSDLVSIKVQRLENFKNLFIGHLNINSIRNKFEMMADIASNFSIFLISESKLDSYFPNSQFKINGHNIFRRDRTRYGGGLLLYVHEEIPCKILNQQTASSNSEIIAMQFFQTKRKWLLLGIYKPPKQNNSEVLETINLLLNDYTETYENRITILDFNMTVENPQLNGFMQLHDMSQLINEPTCFQSHDPTYTNTF